MFFKHPSNVTIWGRKQSLFSYSHLASDMLLLLTT